MIVRCAASRGVAFRHRTAHGSQTFSPRGAGSYNSA